MRKIPTEEEIRRDERGQIADELLAWASESGTRENRALRAAALRIAPETSDEEMRAALAGMLERLAANRDGRGREASDDLVTRRCVDVLRQARASLPGPVQCFCVFHGRADGLKAEPGQCATCDWAHRDLQARAAVEALLDEIGEHDGAAR